MKKILTSAIGRNAGLYCLYAAGVIIVILQLRSIIG